MTGTKWGATRGRYASSLQGRVEAYYAANPTALLTKQQACAEFECTPTQWRDLVARLRQGKLALEAVTVFRVAAVQEFKPRKPPPPPFIRPKAPPAPPGPIVGTCARCGVPHDRIGPKRVYSYCRKCASELSSAWKRANPSTGEARLKEIARSLAGVYMRRGLIELQPCEDCGSEFVEMHHDDYSKPLQVRFFAVVVSSGTST